MTIDINGRKVKVDPSFRNLSPEDQDKAVEEIAAEMNISAQPQDSGPSGFAAFAGSAPFRAVGAGVELANAVAGRAVQEARALGRTFGEPGGMGQLREELREPSSGLVERPLGGMQDMSAVANFLRSSMPTRDPETLPEYIGQFTGESATALPVMLRGAQMLEGGRGVVGGLSRAFTRETAERPVRTASIEAAAAATGGTARMVGEQNELGPFSQASLEMGGAMMGGAAAALSPINAMTGLYRKGMAVFPFTEQGGLRRASKGVQGLVQNPEQAARMIDDLKGTALLPSARTEEPGLMAIEAHVLAQDPARAARISRQSADTTADLVNQIRQSGNIQDTRKFVAAKRERLVKALDARIEQAGDEAASVVASMGVDPSTGQAQASVAVREALETALADAKVQEGMLWQAIPQDARVPVQNVVAKHKELRKQLSSAQIEDMPVYVTRAMGIIRERKITKTTVREMDGLYKKLGEVATAARASGERNKARIAEEMRESIWQSLELAEGGPQVREAIDTARGFSQTMNEKFRRGAVGRILGYSREGGAAVAPESTLDVALGPLRKGLLGARSLEKATESPVILEGIQDYLKSQFVRNAVVDGRVDPKKTATFFKQNAELLDAMPTLKNQLQAARSAEDAARRVTDHATAFKKALDRPDVSAAARFLKAPVDQEVARIMSSADPERYFKQLRSMAIKQKNGEAMNGLKAGLSEWLIKEATSAGSIDIAGRPLFNGMRLRSIMQEPRVANAMKTVYSKQELENISKLADLTAKLQRQSLGAGKIDAIDDLPSRLIEIPARVLGAKIGAKMSGTAGGSIQTAKIGSTTVFDFIKRLTGDKASQLVSDAIENPELMAALLRHNSSASTQQRAAYERSIRAYLAGPGARLMDEQTRELLNEENRRR